MTKSRDLSQSLIILLGTLSIVLVGFATAVILLGGKPAERAVIGMAWGLLIVWVLIGGMLMLRFRDRITQLVLAIPLNWQLKFVLFATILTLVEEAITTTMTNLASLFGVAYGQAYITASGNYLEVILFHSVIVIVPMFIAWSWLLKRYAFKPNTVFLLFGLTGVLTELGLGPLNPMWVFVYGLMVYLPAASIPSDRGAKPVGLVQIVLALFLPLLSAIPVAVIINLIHQQADGSFRRRTSLPIHADNNQTNLT